MRWQYLLVCCCVAFAPSLWSCNSSGSSSDGGTNHDSGTNNGNDAGNGVTQAERDLANALCQKLGSCAPLPLQVLYGDVRGCASRVALTVAAGTGINGATVGQATIEACAAAYGGLTCTELEDGITPAECNITGSLANGTMCGIGLQCQTGYCKVPTGATCGACSAKASGGGACTTTADCPQGDYCNNNVCAALGGTGVGCDAGVRCLGAYYCNATSRTCQSPAISVGAPCSPQSLGSCSGEDGLYCTIGGTCAQIGLAATGSSCGLVGTSIVLCSDGGTCALATQFSGTCVAPAADGTACSMDGGTPNCFPPATCQGGICTLPNPGGCH
jgi:hypothetical protein